MSSVAFTTNLGHLSVSGQKIAINMITIVLFGIAGMVCGFAAARRDVVPLVSVEVIACGFITLAILIAAVETGMSAVVRNVWVGGTGLAALGVMYFVAQRLRR